ncbi:hypothetical protein C0Q70_20228 [Pomacea canaliculata]|uniref:G-protein coupled receptors family 1 profile domain-containing protein n=1 Tax=Pomacea canaliculata TaxID=400727 RepID=A0A2T7NEX3_POMCA|nr:hypothetical protein C0Q70_20228 [Pomacea canaliculata]
MTQVDILTQDVLVACIMVGLTAVVGVLGNGLMLRALVLYPNLRIDLFILLSSVAVSDVLCLVVAVPRHIINLTESVEPVTDLWCKASKYLEIGAGFVSAYHLVVLAVLRAILLTSRGHNPPTVCQTLTCAVVLWVVALLGAVPFLLNEMDEDGFCHYTPGADITKDLHDHVIYLLTYLVGKRYFEDSYSYREKRISRLVTVIIVVFALCQLPYRAVDLHLSYREREAERSEHLPEADTFESLYIARNYLLCLLMADKAARPVIYSKLAPDLAQAFDEVINCTLCSRYYTKGRRPVGAISHTTRLPSTASEAPLTGSTDNTDNKRDEASEIIQL